MVTELFDTGKCVKLKSEAVGDDAAGDVLETVSFTIGGVMGRGDRDRGERSGENTIDRRRGSSSGIGEPVIIAVCNATRDRAGISGTGSRMASSTFLSAGTLNVNSKEVGSMAVERLESDSESDDDKSKFELPIKEGPASVRGPLLS